MDPMGKDFQAEKGLSDYVVEAFRPEDAVLREIRERSAREGLPQIHVAPMDGLHLEVLCRVGAVRRAVEIGTLAGYSAVCIARALPRDGRLCTLELDPRHGRVATESFQRAGVADRIDLRVGPALDSLRALEAEGPIDFLFVDADKVGYPAYLEWAGRNLRQGGIVAADNTLAWGMIADRTFATPEDEAAVLALREFNATIANPSGRFRGTLLPTGEGLTVAVKLR